MGIMQKHEWEFRLKDGNCRVQAVRDNIIRCSYTKERTGSKSHLLALRYVRKALLVSVRTEKKLFSGQREWF